MNINFNLQSLSVYRNVLDSTILQNLSKIFELQNDKIENTKDFYKAISLYSQICSKLFEEEISLSEYVLNLILYDENIFSLKCSKNSLDQINKTLKDAAFRDIEILLEIARLTSTDLKKHLKSIFPSYENEIDSLSDYETQDISYDALKIASFYHQNSFGLFAKYSAFQFGSNKILKPVKNLDDIRLQDLKLYEIQRQKVLENTLFLLRGTPCCNVLLYGDRGTGKSSTVKAILNEYSAQGLRMIQLRKDDLILLPDLMEKVAKIPLKFIIFIDDLTFNENDYNFGAMKTVLEGSLSKQPLNTAIYVTTNRRHLIKETFSSREGDEIHKADTIDETVSLADRFGLSVTFSIPNKDNYLEIVRQIALDRKIIIDKKDLFSQAERFALLKNARTPRLARQFVDYIESRCTSVIH